MAIVKKKEYFPVNTSTSVGYISYRKVYEKLLADGTIVPEPERPPPTVPMDYTWARVNMNI